MSYLECSCGTILHSKHISEVWKDHQNMNSGEHREVKRYSFLPRQEATA